ncbi:MAG: VWA domain-containing protein [Treponema sp.]|nr:VWA domain-containing protein [Treponema sp.]
MPDFQNPAAFLFLLLVPALYVARSFKLFSGISFPITLSDWGGKTFEWKGRFRSFASYVSRVFAIAGFIAGVTALADPVSYHQERIYTSRGTDIIFVVDTSPSMAASDMANATRLDEARRSIRMLADSVGGMSFGLVAMAREAAVIVPPTPDRNAFLAQLDALAVGNLGDGSAIGTGLSTAVYHLASSSAPKKCIVLVTDGENNAGSIHPETAAELAKKNDILVYVLGIGTRGTVPLNYVDPKTGRVYSGYLQSEFDPVPLQRIAAVSGGRYYSVQSAGDLSNVLSSIGREVNVAQTYHLRTESTHRYDKLIVIAAALFIFAWLMCRIYLQEYM